MTPLSHRHRNSHEDIPKPYTTGAQMPCRTGGGSGGGRTPGGGSGGGRSCPKLTDDGQEWWSITKTCLAVMSQLTLSLHWLHTLLPIIQWIVHTLKV